MKYMILTVLAFMAAYTSISQASVDWVGDVQVKENRRGSTYSHAYDGNPIQVNLCEYGLFTITFEVYKAGVTDSGGPVWQMINAKMRTTQDSTQYVLKTGSPSVIGTHGNNAVYQIQLQGQNMSPSTLTGLDPASKSTHLTVSLDGSDVLYLPISYSCQN